MRQPLFIFTFCFAASLLAGCFGPSEMSPRYVSGSGRDRINPDGNFSGVHLHGIPDGWDYLTEPGSGPGDMARVANARYVVEFWLSTMPSHEDPRAGVQEIREVRAQSYLYGESFEEWDVSRADRASITYSVDRAMDGQHVEVQRTAFRRLFGPFGKRVTMELHGRWPMRSDDDVRRAFDAIVDGATLQ